MDIDKINNDFFSANDIKDEYQKRFIMDLVKFVSINNFDAFGLKVSTRTLGKITTTMIGFLIEYGFRPKDIAEVTGISVQAVHSKYKSGSFKTSRDIMVMLAMSIYSNLTHKHGSDFSRAEFRHQFDKEVSKLSTGEMDKLFGDSYLIRGLLLSTERAVKRIKRLDRVLETVENKIVEKSAESFTGLELDTMFKTYDEALDRLYSGSPDLYTDRGLKSEAGLDVNSIDDSKMYNESVKKFVDNTSDLENGLDDMKNGEEITQSDVNDLLK